MPANAQAGTGQNAEHATRDGRAAQQINTHVPKTIEYTQPADRIAMGTGDSNPRRNDRHGSSSSRDTIGSRLQTPIFEQRRFS